MEKIRVLFVCTHNGARSQMAEAYLNKLAGDRFFAESAGIEAGELNPLAVEAMKQDGIDISGNKTKSVFDFYKQGKHFAYVITVCEKEAADKCPVFIGVTKRIQWSFANPEKFTGTLEEKVAQTVAVRDGIKQAVTDLIKSIQ
jgi:arsenate reductase